MFGDIFIFGGEVVWFEGFRENEVYVFCVKIDNFMILFYMGGKFLFFMYLVESVCMMLVMFDSWMVLFD